VRLYSPPDTPPEIVGADLGQALHSNQCAPTWQVDIAVTKRALIKDLALLPGDFTASGNNYLFGDAVTLSADVRNLGDLD